MELGRRATAVGSRIDVGGRWKEIPARTTVGVEVWKWTIETLFELFFSVTKNLGGRQDGKWRGIGVG